jgi:hypothetical protein
VGSSILPAMNDRRVGRYVVYAGLVMAGLSSWLELDDWIYPLQAAAVLALAVIWLPNIKRATEKLAKIRLVVALLFAVCAIALSIQRELFTLSTLAVIALGLAVLALDDIRYHRVEGGS